MIKASVKMGVFVLIFGFLCSSVSAAVIEKLIDFESPTYATGDLNGQNNWSAPSSDHQVQTTDVLSGAQSASSGVAGASSYATLPLSQENLNFADGYSISYLVKMENKSYGIVQLDCKTGVNTYDAYIQVLHDARLSTTDRVKVNGVYVGGAGYFKDGEIHKITLTLDFTNQNVDVVIQEISGDNPGNVVSADNIAFSASASPESAKEGQFKLRSAYLYNNVRGIQVVDDITFTAVPEPATIGLIGMGIGSLSLFRKN